MSVAFNPQGTILVTGGADKVVRLWSASNGVLLAELRGHSAAVTSASFDPAGHRLVTSSMDRTVRIWDSPVGGATGQLETPSGAWVLSVRYAANGKTLAGASTKNAAYIWDGSSGRILRKLEDHSQIFRSIGFGAIGRLAITTHDSAQVRIWNVVSNTEPKLFDPPGQPVQAAVLSVDGALAATGDAAGVVRIFDPSTLGEKKWIDAGREVTSLAFKRDATLLLVGGQGVAQGSGSDHQARLWDMRTFEPKSEPVSHPRPVTSVAFSPTGPEFATGSEDGIARIWRENSQTARLELVGHRARITDVAFSSDGAFLLTASADHTARLWDMSSGRQVGVFFQNDDELYSADFAPDARNVVIGGRGGAYVFDCEPCGSFDSVLRRAEAKLAAQRDTIVPETQAAGSSTR
jgi:WD40 repeat protein